jgi:hypothetical protein
MQRTIPLSTWFDASQLNAKDPSRSTDLQSFLKLWSPDGVVRKGAVLAHTTSEHPWMQVDEGASPFDASPPDWVRGAAQSRRALDLTLPGGLSQNIGFVLTARMTRIRRASQQPGGATHTLGWILLPTALLAINKREFALPAQTIRLAVAQFAPTQVAAIDADKLFAGLRIKSGKLVSDQDLVISQDLIIVPYAATLTLTVDVDSGAAQNGSGPFAPDVTNATVSLPATATLQFKPGFASLLSAQQISANFVGQTFNATYDPGGTARYFEFGEVRELIFPFNLLANSEKTLDFATWQSDFAKFSGGGKILNPGWTLPVAKAAGPDFASLIHGGAFFLPTENKASSIRATWPGATRTTGWDSASVLLTPSHVQIVVLGNETAYTQRVKLYSPTQTGDADADLELRFFNAKIGPNLPASGLLYSGIRGTKEQIAWFARAKFNLHQPLTTRGARARLDNMLALALITRNAKGQRIAVAPIAAAGTSAFAGADQQTSLIAFENGLLRTVPMFAGTVGDYDGKEVSKGIVGFLALVDGVRLTLPDPYAASANTFGRSLNGLLVIAHAWASDSESTSHWSINQGISVAPKTIGPIEGFNPFGTSQEPSSRILLDLSGRADQFGVAVNAISESSAAPVLRASGTRLSIAGNRLCLVTLPPFSWEPMVGLPIDAKQIIEQEQPGFRPAAIIWTPNLPAPDRWKFEWPLPFEGAASNWSFTWPPFFGQRDPAFDPNVGAAYPYETKFRVISSDERYGDGELATVQVPTQELIAIEPTRLALKYATLIHTPHALDQPKFQANLDLPFGLRARIIERNPASTFTLERPKFGSRATRIQLSFRAGQMDDKPNRFGGSLQFAGYSNPVPSNVPGYAQRVLGVSVTEITRNELGEETNSTGQRFDWLPAVPLLRYDLSGYGASLFSNWTDYQHKMVNGGPTCVAQMQFEAIVGRVAREKVVVDSVIYPWGIKVRRTVTVERKQAGWMLRRDSGWVAISDATFEPFSRVEGVEGGQAAHRGLMFAVKQIDHIRETVPELLIGDVNKQEVHFDGVAFIEGAGPNGVTLRDAWGYIRLDPNPPKKEDTDGMFTASAADTALIEAAEIVKALSPDTCKARGRLDCMVNLLDSGFMLQATQLIVTPFSEFNVFPTLCVAVAGSPVLPRQGAWTVTHRMFTETERQSLPPGAPVPVIRPNGDATLYFADPTDVFHVKQTETAGLAKHEYAFMQDTGTQKLLQPYPRLTKLPNPGSVLGGLTDDLPFGDIRSLLGGSGLFPNDVAVVAWDFSGLPAESRPHYGANGFTFNASNVPLVTKDQGNLRRTILSEGVVKVDLCYGTASAQGASFAVASPSTLDASISDSAWSLNVNNLSLIVSGGGYDLFAIRFTSLAASSTAAPALRGGSLEYSSYLGAVVAVLNALTTILKSAATPGSTPPAPAPAPVNAVPLASPSGGEGLKVDFSNGRLTIGESIGVSRLPLGFGELREVIFEVGGSLQLLPKAEAAFGLSLGSEKRPVTWIATPLAGDFYLRFGISTANGTELAVRGGLGLGIAISVAVASGHASIIIAMQVDLSGSSAKLTVILVGNAGVDVLGGVASADLDLEATASIESTFDASEVTLRASVGVGIHISICWLIDVDFEGSWPFEKQIAR